MRLKRLKLMGAFYIGAAIMGISFSEVFSQEIMIITKKDNTVLKVPISEIQSISFSTSSTSENDNTVKDIDGNIYKTVKINDQVWMAENLRTTKLNNGISIPLVTDKIEWTKITTPGFCWYENDENANKNTYGALYNWYAVENNNVCPIGWHVPTNSDWDNLAKYLGSSAGSKLKESGTVHWDSSNANATNITGFTALGGGYRNSSTGNFAFKGGTGLWWTSSALNTLNSSTRAMWSSNSTVGAGSYLKALGASIRCLKD